MEGPEEGGQKKLTSLSIRNHSYYVNPEAGKCITCNITGGEKRLAASPRGGRFRRRLG